MAIQGFKNLRSPFNVVVVDDGSSQSANIDIWVYSGSAEQSSAYLNNTDPTYSLTSSQKLFYKGLDEFAYIFEISKMVSDYLDVKFTGTHSDDNHIVVSYQYSYTDNSSGSAVITQSSIESYFCVEGYDYFSDGTGSDTSSDIDDKVALQTNNTIYTYGNEPVTIRVNKLNLYQSTFYYNNETLTEFNGSVIGGVIPSLSTTQLDSTNTHTANEIEVEHNNGDIQIIKVIKIDECRYEPYKVTFLNRFGVYQDLWFFKKSKLSSKFEREHYNNESIFSRGFRDTHTKIAINTKSTDSIVLNSGFVEEGHNEVFRELMLSESVYIKYDGKTLPINITDDELNYKTSVNDRLIEYTIKADFSFSQINNLR